MRRLLFGLAGVVLLALAMSCSEADEIRTGIDDLNARLDAISAQVDRINGDLAYSRGVITGSIAILGYSKDAYGNYTVEFSDGGEMTIYSGEVCGDIPVFSVGDDGWTYTADGETYPLLGPDGQPAPVSGSTPKVRVNGDGRWEYSFDGSIWMSGFGSALPSAGSIFDDVYPSEENDGLVFKWHSGDSDYEKMMAEMGY